MTLRSRNLLVFFILTWVSLSLILLLFFYFKYHNFLKTANWSHQLDFGFLVNPSYKNAHLVSSVSSIFMQLYSAITALTLYLIFRKNHTNEIVVLMIVLLSNLCWFFRILIPYTGSLIPLSLGEGFVRLAYFGYYLATAAFLYGSLNQADYGRYINDNLITSFLILLFLFWIVIPIDNIKIYANNLMDLADKEMAIGIYFSMMIIIILTSVMRLFISKSYKNVMSVLIIMGFLLALFILFYASMWYHFFIGACLLITSTFFYIVRLRSFYVWSKF